ncbi:MAG: EamA family transporter [Pseudomonadota bacterium]|nr:EamA family transporter [Burkholderiaceae bacterium]MDQ3446427.1 EamA family transporter [Pseudomonadota bacterium]
MGEGVNGGRPAAWLAAAPLAFVLLWSTGFIVAKYAAPHAPPLTFLLYRFAGAIAILLPIIAVTRAPWPSTARTWRDVVIVGVLLQATYLGGVWVAIALGMPAGVSALLVGAQPLLTAGLVFTVGERASRLQWAGLIIGFAGIALVLSDRLTLAGVALPALAVNFLALAGITAGTLYQKKHVADVDLRTGSLIQFAASFVVLLPFAIATESMVVDFTLEFWLALAWSIVALSLVAITLLLVMIRRGRATDVTSLMYLTPPATAVLAWLMFGETLGVLAWGGVLVTMAGVALVLTTGERRHG